MDSGRQLFSRSATPAKYFSQFRAGTNRCPALLSSLFPPNPPPLSRAWFPQTSPTQSWSRAGQPISYQCLCYSPLNSSSSKEEISPKFPKHRKRKKRLPISLLHSIFSCPEKGQRAFLPMVVERYLLWAFLAKSYWIATWLSHRFCLSHPGSPPARFFLYPTHFLYALAPTTGGSSLTRHLAFRFSAGRPCK